MTHVLILASGTFPSSLGANAEEGGGGSGKSPSPSGNLPKRSGHSYVSCPAPGPIPLCLQQGIGSGKNASYLAPESCRRQRSVHSTAQPFRPRADGRPPSPPELAVDRCGVQQPPLYQAKCLELLASADQELTWEPPPRGYSGAPDRCLFPMPGPQPLNWLGEGLASLLVDRSHRSWSRLPLWTSQVILLDLPQGTQAFPVPHSFCPTLSSFPWDASVDPGWLIPPSQVLAPFHPECSSWSGSMT